MAGHSKWSQIKRKKGLKDQQKGKIFSKLTRQITLAVLEGGGITDPDKSVKLRIAMDQARRENMPKENIQRAIEKGVGPDREKLQEVMYEGFGPEGISLLIQVTTDNSNRTHSEVKSVLDRHNGKIGTQGSVGYLFQKCAIITFDKVKNAEDAVFTFADQVQVLDIDEDDSNITVYFPFENLGRISNYLGGLEANPAEVDYRPLSTVKINNQQTAKKIIDLIEALESLDDVQKVYSNFDIPEEFLTSPHL